MRPQEGGALRAGEEDGWQRRRKEPVGRGLAEEDAQIIPCITPRDRTDGPALRLQRSEVGLQRWRPRGRIPAGGINRALLRAGRAEGVREIPAARFCSL